MTKKYNRRLHEWDYLKLVEQIRDLIQEKYDDLTAEDWE